MRKCSKLFAGMDVRKDSIDVATVDEAGGEVPGVVRLHASEYPGWKVNHYRVWCEREHGRAIFNALLRHLNSRWRKNLNSR